METAKTVRNSDLFADVEQMLGEGGKVRLRVKGYSMRPFLRNERDIVRLAPVDRAGLRKGMVILFRYRGTHMLHRIRRIEGDRLVVKGDGNYKQAEYTTRGEVAAYAESIERGGKPIPYRSLKWHLLSFASLTWKLIRTTYYDTLGTVKKLIFGKDGRKV